MCAVVAFCYAEVLVRPGEVFAGFGKWLTKGLRKVTIINEREEVRENILYKPLIGCSKCVAGQLALWSYLFKPGYHFGHHVFVICLAILLTLIIKSFFNQFVR